jgi:hypothetical protein
MDSAAKTHDGCGAGVVHASKAVANDAFDPGGQQSAKPNASRNSDRRRGGGPELARQKSIRLTGADSLRSDKDKSIFIRLISITKTLFSNCGP